MTVEEIPRECDLLERNRPPLDKNRDTSSPIAGGRHGATSGSVAGVASAPKRCSPCCFLPSVIYQAPLAGEKPDFETQERLSHKNLISDEETKLTNANTGTVAGAL